MKRVRIILALALVGCVIGSSTVGSAQISIPKANIPSDVPDDVRKKIEQLYLQDPAKRAAAACALGEMTSRAAPAIPFLISLLSDGAAIDPDRSCRNEFPFEDEEWQPGFEEVSESNVGQAATQALIAINEPALDPLIVTLLKASHWRARKNAAWALLHRGGVEGAVMEALIVALEDEAWQVRAQAAFALGHKGASQIDVVEPLLGALKDYNARVRESAAMGLWHNADERAYGPLIAALADEDSRVRSSIAHALGNRVDNEGVQVLIATLDHEDANVRKGVRQALEIARHRSQGQVTNLRPFSIPASNRR
jgi:HEAT repeat protein